MRATPLVVVERGTGTRFQLLSAVLLFLLVLALIPQHVVSQYHEEEITLCEESSICFPGGVTSTYLSVVFTTLATTTQLTSVEIGPIYDTIALVLDLSPTTNAFQICLIIGVCENVFVPIPGRRLLQTDSPVPVSFSVSFNDNANSTGRSAASLAAAFQNVLSSSDASTLLTPANSVFVSVPPQNVTVESSDFLVSSSDVQTGSLCFISYALPGNVDYPWSLATSLSFEYDDVPVATGHGTASLLINGSGTRTFTNRFGVSFTTPLTLDNTHGNLLYLNSTSPVDVFGLQFNMSSPVQLPGAGPLAMASIITVLNASGVLVEAGASRFDALGQAFLSSVPGFSNVLIGASNENALAVNYTACKAPITFVNGMRQPTEPSATNGAVHFLYSYFISDGVSYTVSTNLTVTASSAFATTVDKLGNPYQAVVNITGIRRYTYLPSGAQIISQVTGLSTAILAQPDQRFYPYSFLASSPGVYSEDTVPFLDSDGLGFALTPSVPANGVAPGVGTQYSATSVFVSAGNSAVSSSVLTEARVIHQPLLTLQQQSYRLLA